MSSPDPPGEDPNATEISLDTIGGEAPKSSTAAQEAEKKTISCVSCRKRKLKCDRVKPRCGTCVRLRHDCEFPERRRNQGQKRRNMKELEARLAQVETQLETETKAKGQTPGFDFNNMGTGIDMDLEAGDLLDSFDVMQSGGGFGFGGAGQSLSAGVEDFFSQELIAMGLDEPLPPQDMIDELHDIYFTKWHHTMPIMHKYRYLSSLDRAPHMRPPICLRYAIWLTAASLSDNYQMYESIFYERTRRYLQAAEMKGMGEQFVSVYHSQTWSLVAFYEAKKTYFSRSWMSTGRAVRLAQMLGLNRVDTEDEHAQKMLPPSRDWIELEERRRTFWAAFYGDRWASSGTGWPMLLQEYEIQTNLPGSEEGFENNISEETIPLSQGLTPEGAPKITTFGGVILAATLFGHNFQHIQRSGPKWNPEDVNDGEFWKRHRKMDNTLSNTFMFLPPHLRLPTAIHDTNIVFIHMNLHASVICLHRASILTGNQHEVDQAVIRHSQVRSLMAAQEITNIMRLTCHVDPGTMSPWVGFCLYVAAGIFVNDAKSKEADIRSIGNLDFLLAAMRAIGKVHSLNNHFSAQLELDLEAAGITNKGRPRTQTINTGLPSDEAQKSKEANVPNVPINGLVPERRGAPMTLNNLKDLLRSSEGGSSPGREGDQVNRNITVNYSDEHEVPLPPGTAAFTTVPGMYDHLKTEPLPVSAPSAGNATNRIFSPNPPPSNNNTPSVPVSMSTIPTTWAPQDLNPANAIAGCFPTPFQSGNPQHQQFISQNSIAGNVNGDSGSGTIWPAGKEIPLAANAGSTSSPSNSTSTASNLPIRTSTPNPYVKDLAMFRESGFVGGKAADHGDHSLAGNGVGVGVGVGGNVHVQGLGAVNGNENNFSRSGMNGNGMNGNGMNGNGLNVNGLNGNINFTGQGIGDEFGTVPMTMQEWIPRNEYEFDTMGLVDPVEHVFWGAGGFT